MQDALSGGGWDLESAVKEAADRIERMLEYELKGVFVESKIDGLTFSGINSAFSSELEDKIAQMTGNRPRVAPVSLVDFLVAIVCGNNG